MKSNLLQLWQNIQNEFALILIFFFSVTEITDVDWLDYFYKKKKKN